MENIQIRSKRYALSVVNHKGGVGKTTTAVNLSACLGERGSRVLLIDLDPQGSASLALGCSDNGERLFQAIQKTIALPVRSTEVLGVDLVPAGPQLIGAWQRFSGALGKELLQRCLRYTEGQWDWIIIDCPPSLGILTLTALNASNGVLIPVEATPLAVTGLEQMITTIGEVAKDHRDGLPKLQAIVPCRATHAGAFMVSSWIGSNRPIRARLRLSFVKTFLSPNRLPTESPSSPLPLLPMALRTTGKLRSGLTAVLLTSLTEVGGSLEAQSDVNHIEQSMHCQEG